MSDYSHSKENHQRTTADNLQQAPDTHRAYEDLTDYADFQGAPVEAFIAAGWMRELVMRRCPATKQPRPALQFLTATGARWRFIDGHNPKYTNPTGYERSWYRLDEAIDIAQQTGQPLTICNGEASTVVSQTHGIAATAMTGGEKKKLPDNLLNELKARWGGALIVALDCDTTGRTAAGGMTHQLQQAGYDVHMVDLKLTDGGDLGNFARLHQQDARRQLAELPAEPLPEPQRKPARKVANMQRWTAAHNDYERAVEDIKQRIIPDRLNINDRRTNGDGFTVQRIANPFISHDNDDRAPATVYNFESGTLYDHKGDHSYNIRELCDLLNVEWPGVKRSSGAGRSINLDAAPGEPSDDAQLSAPTEIDHAPDAEIDAAPPGEDDINPLPVFTPDIQVNMRYVSPDMLGYRTLALKSRLATGKTEAVIRYIRKHDIKRVLFVTHLEALTRNQAERLNNAGVTVELYSTIPHEFSLGSIDKLVCSLNSLHRLHDATPYDLVVFDEAEQGIPHLWGGTMKGAEQTRALATLKKLLTEAKQVIALDAHMSDLTGDWLKSLRESVIRLENDYRHDWGKLVLSLDHAATLEAGQALADSDVGTVVFMSNSRNEAQMLHRHFADRYGKDAVAAVHGWTSHDHSVRELIKHINDRLPELRVFICSPSVSTGVDVSAHVAGVFGLFRPQPGTATDLMQMVARFRNAGTRMVHIMHSERPNLVTEPGLLLYRTRYNVAQTARLADFNLHNITNVTALQGQLTQLWATYEAQRNRQKVDLRAAFVRLAAVEGFEVVWDDTPATGNMKATIKAAWEAKREHDDHMKLTSPAVTPETMDALRMAGDLTEDHFYGLERWKIEHTTGQGINAELLDAYKSKHERAALRRFTDHMQYDIEIVKERDRYEVERLPADRRHHTTHQTLLDRALLIVFGKAGLNSTEEIPAAELEDRTARFIEENLKTLQNLEGRNDLSENTIPALRRLFKRFHIRLASKQMRIDGERVQVYYIDPDDLAVKRDRAVKRQAYLDALSTNAERDSHTRVRRQAGRYSVKTPDDDEKELHATAKKHGIPVEQWRAWREIEF